MKFVVGTQSKWGPDLLQAFAQEIKPLNPQTVIIVNAGDFDAAVATVSAGISPAQIICTDYRPDAILLGTLFVGGDVFAQAGQHTVESKDPAQFTADLLLMRVLEHEAKKNPFIARGAGALMQQERNGDGRLAKNAQRLRDTAKALNGISFKIAAPESILETYLDDAAAVIVVANVTSIKKDNIAGWKWQEWEDRFLSAKATVFVHDQANRNPVYKMPCVALRRSKSHIDAEVERLMVNRRTTERCYTNRPIKGMELPKWKPMTNEVIRPESNIAFHAVTSEEAIYYRNLWIHGLGATEGRECFLMSCDGVVMATIGLNLDKVQRRVDKWVYEMFGTPAQNMRYKRLGKLMMMLLTCKDAHEFIRKTWLRPADEINGIRTTSFCKNPEHKIARGVLKTTFREQQPNGIWKLKFEAPFTTLNIQQTVAKWFKDKSSAKERTI